jgi:hypothetical protein
MSTQKTTETEGGLLSEVGFLFERVAGGLRGVAQALADSVEQGTLRLVRKVLRSFGFFFFSVLAAVFLLVGVARILDTVYQLPGIGEVVVGTFIFSGVLVCFMIDRQTS